MFVAVEEVREPFLSLMSCGVVIGGRRMIKDFWIRMMRSSAKRFACLGFLEHDWRRHLHFVPLEVCIPSIFVYSILFL